MKFTTLDGREIRLEIKPSRYPIRSSKDSKSRGQYYLGRQLVTIYPNITILEEFTIPGSRLRLDFYLPTAKLAFEFQGEQHDAFNTFFHGNKKGFERSKARDQQKEQWCTLNDIRLIKVYARLTKKELMELIYE